MSYDTALMAHHPQLGGNRFRLLVVLIGLLWRHRSGGVVAVVERVRGTASLWHCASASQARGPRGGLRVRSAVEQNQNQGQGRIAARRLGGTPKGPMAAGPVRTVRSVLCESMGLIMVAR